jgi:hypothetical protein
MKSFSCQEFLNGEHETCKENGCHIRHHAKGYCLKHYRQLWRKGIVKPFGSTIIKPVSTAAPQTIQKKY